MFKKNTTRNNKKKRETEMKEMRYDSQRVRPRERTPEAPDVGHSAKDWDPPYTHTHTRNTLEERETQAPSA